MPLSVVPWCALMCSGVPWRGKISLVNRHLKDLQFEEMWQMWCNWQLGEEEENYFLSELGIVGRKWHMGDWPVELLDFDYDRHLGPAEANCWTGGWWAGGWVGWGQTHPRPPHHLQGRTHLQKELFGKISFANPLTKILTISAKALTKKDWLVWKAPTKKIPSISSFKYAWLTNK